jgi:hypothetical protein
LELQSPSTTNSPYFIPSLYGRILRKLHTIVCAALIMLSNPSRAFAQGANESAGKLTNADILKLSLSEQKYWVHGAISGLAHGLMYNDIDQGQCIWDWYFKPGANRLPTIRAAFERYPDASPSSTIIAITGRACPAK